MKPVPRVKKPDKRLTDPPNGEGVCVRFISPTDVDVGRWWDHVSKGSNVWRADVSDVAGGVARPERGSDSWVQILSGLRSEVGSSRNGRSCEDLYECM